LLAYILSMLLISSRKFQKNKPIDRFFLDCLYTYFAPFFPICPNITAVYWGIFPLFLLKVFRHLTVYRIYSLFVYFANVKREGAFQLRGLEQLRGLLDIIAVLIFLIYVIQRIFRAIIGRICQSLKGKKKSWKAFEKSYYKIYFWPKKNGVIR
jgi:hypothetical protein